MLNANLINIGRAVQDAVARRPINPLQAALVANPMLGPALAARTSIVNPAAFQSMAQTRENENIAAQREFLNRPQRPIINQGTGNTILGAAALAALLGASPEAINQGFGNFLQGTMARRQEEDERERALLQLQMAERQLQGQRAEGTANRLQQAQDRMRQMVEQGRGQMGNILMGLTNASDPLQVQLGIDQANDIARRAGLPTVSPTVAGRLTRGAEERAQEAAALRQLGISERESRMENMQRDDIANNILRMHNVIQMMGKPPAPGTPVYNRLLSQYQALEKRANEIGLVMPPFEAVIAPNVRQENLSLQQRRQNWREQFERARLEDADADRQVALRREQRLYNESSQRFAGARSRAQAGEQIDKPEQQVMVSDVRRLLTLNQRAFNNALTYQRNTKDPAKQAEWAEHGSRLLEDSTQILLELSDALGADNPAVTRLAREFKITLPDPAARQRMAQDMQRAFERGTGAGGSNSGNRPAP